MEKITIGGREIPLRFTMNQFAEVEEEVGFLSELRELIAEKRERVRNVIRMIRIMGNAGLAKAGEKPDLTDEWIGENMKPFQLAVYQQALLACIAEAGQSEAEREENEDKERDLVLEEINRKKKDVSSPSEG